MKHRVFVGLPISEKLQEEILDWEKKLQNLPVRWLQGKNLHITLVPPWYEENLEKVKNALQTVAESGAFEMGFSKVAFGPNPRQPRLVWAEGEARQELADLQKRICEALGKSLPAGRQEPERRPLKLHLTLARFRPGDFSSFEIQKLDEKIDWRERASRVVLFETILSQRGADYQIISEISL